MLQVSMYVFAQIIVNSVKRDPCGLERWKRFLEGVEIKALSLFSPPLPLYFFLLAPCLASPTHP